MMGFGVLCLLTAAYFAFSGTTMATTSLPPQGGRIGPLTITKANTILSVEVHQPFRTDGWSYLEAEVQDPEGEYLFGFGDELWAESGRDSDGAWHEEKTDYDVDLTIPQAGTYYLAFSGSDSTHPQGTQQVGVSPGQPNWSPGGDFAVKVVQRHGSWVPFLPPGIIALLLGPILFYFGSAKLRRALANASG